MLISKIYMNKYTEEYKNENNINKNTLANVDIIIDRNIKINGIKLMDGHKGKYLNFPIDSLGKNIAFPIKDDVRQLILESVIEEYNKD